jgi:cardiolipin synthase
MASGCGDKRFSYVYANRLAVRDPSFSRSLESLGNTMVPGNQAVLLHNGDEIFPAMTGAIRAAKKSVSLESYIFIDDEAGRLFGDALMDAAKKGVKVRVLVDAWGSKMGKLGDELKAAGVDLREYRPVNPFTLHKLSKRTHRKIMVIDGRISFTGGMCIDKRWLGDARNENEWRDTHVEVTGPVSSQMQAIFAEDWTFTTGEILVGDDLYPEVERVGSIPAQAIKVSLGDSSSLAKMQYYLAIKSAEKTIHLQNAYFVPDEQIRTALIDAAKRGVDVKVMVPGRHIDIPVIRSASQKHYGDLLRGGVKIFEYQSTMMHNKTMVVDGIFSVVGSINLDSRSMGKNAEDSLNFYDASFAAKMEASFQEDLARCRPITLESWSKRGFHRRLAEDFSGLFSPLF